MSDVNTGGMCPALKDAKNSRQLMQVSSEKLPNINSIVPELLGKRLLGTRLSVYCLVKTFDSFICIPIHKDMSLAIIKKKAGTWRYKEFPGCLSTTLFTHHIVVPNKKPGFPNRVNVNSSHHSPDGKALVILFLEQYVYWSSKGNHLHLLELWKRWRLQMKYQNVQFASGCGSVIEYCLYMWEARDLNLSIIKSQSKKRNPNLERVSVI